ncbi:hypothetical protein BN439_3382 [Erwinia amylovora Ea644]|nr:hypothetical protein BN439_3382 [Erwinia amylovora Ea644]
MSNFSKISSLFLRASERASPRPVKMPRPGNLLVSKFAGVENSSNRADKPQNINNEPGVFLKAFLAGYSTGLPTSEARLKDELNTFIGQSRDPVPGKNNFHAALNLSAASVRVARSTKRPAPQPGILAQFKAAVDAAPGSPLDHAPQDNQSGREINLSAASVRVARSTKRPAPQPGIVAQFKAAVDAAPGSPLNDPLQERPLCSEVNPSAASVRVRQSVKRQAPQPPVQAKFAANKAQVLADFASTKNGAPPTILLKDFMRILASVSDSKRSCE